MEKRKELIVYRKRSMDKVVRFIDSLKCKGIAATQKLAPIASTLEAGKPLKEYIEEEKREEDM